MCIGLFFDYQAGIDKKIYLFFFNSYIIIEQKKVVWRQLNKKRGESR